MLLQAEGLPFARYYSSKTRGIAHSPRFCAWVDICMDHQNPYAAVRYAGEEGLTKKQAEQSAAEKAFRILSNKRHQKVADNNENGRPARKCL